MFTRSFFFVAIAAAAPFPQAPSPGSSECTGLNPERMNPDLSAFTDGILLPWTNGSPITDVPRINMSVKGVNGGAPFTVDTDTGSTGMFFCSKSFDNFAELSQGVEDTAHKLRSSGRMYVGKMIQSEVTFIGRSLATGADISAIAEFPILAVQKTGVCPWFEVESEGTVCPPKPPGYQSDATGELEDCDGPLFMGVGFGHGRSNKGYTSPFTNPFLNIRKIDGKDVTNTLREGYIISNKGATLGLTVSNTQDFNWMALPDRGIIEDEPRDWGRAQGAVSVDQTSIAGGMNTCTFDPSCRIRGELLVDTGLANAFINMPPDNVGRPKDPHIVIGSDPPREVQNLPRGTKVTAVFNSDACNTTYAGEYSFTVGEDDVAEPEWTTTNVFDETKGSFLNTGQAFINAFDVAYDAISGRFGLRPSSASGGAA